MKRNDDATIILTHFSLDPLQFDPSRKYIDPSPNFYVKPAGFWLSDEQSNLGWKEWATMEEFEMERLTHRTDFECDTKTWIILKETADFDALRDEFTLPYTSYSLCEKGIELPLCIDWKRVKSKFGGIFITPYSWENRLGKHCFWYYTWDCASACVWDLSTIKVKLE